MGDHDMNVLAVSWGDTALGSFSRSSRRCIVHVDPRAQRNMYVRRKSRNGFGQVFGV